MTIFLKTFFGVLRKFFLFTYVILFRRVHKYMVRKYTKTCEIERMILLKNFKGLGIFYLVKTFWIKEFKFIQLNIANNSLFFQITSAIE